MIVTAELRVAACPNSGHKYTHAWEVDREQKKCGPSWESVGRSKDLQREKKHPAFFFNSG